MTPNPPRQPDPTLKGYLEQANRGRAMNYPYQPPYRPPLPKRLAIWLMRRWQQTVWWATRQP